MKVSVVIPTYNRAAFIVKALQSVLDQTFQDFEIVVVDDGSTDETAEIIRRMDEPRIRFLRQDHRGVSAALNTGWRAAQGEYIARLDSDDRWLPTLLQELLAVLEQDSALAVAYARAQAINAEGALLPQVMGARERFVGATLTSLVYGDFVCPMAVVIRRTALEAVGGYDETLMANEDWDLWIRLAAAYRFAYVPRVLAQYRFHGQNLTRSDSERMERVMQDRARVLDKIFSGPHVPASVLEIKALAYRNLYLDWMIRYLERRDMRRAWRMFRRALAHAPSRALFMPRALAVTVYYLWLSKTRWGVALTEWFVARRRATVL
jgi:glycosyltransferase involved in cell wall biosynthesis